MWRKKQTSKNEQMQQHAFETIMDDSKVAFPTLDDAWKGKSTLNVYYKYHWVHFVFSVASHPAPGTTIIIIGCCMQSKANNFE